MDSSIKFRSISLKSFRSFDDFEINCEKDKSSLYQWTVLLGNNNTGKTSILKAIANLRPVRAIFQTKKNETEYSTVPAYYKRIKDHTQKPTDDYTITSKLTNDEIHWMYNNRMCTVDAKDELAAFYIFGYGVSRYPSKTSLSEQSCGDFDTLFSNDQRLVNI